MCTRSASPSIRPYYHCLPRPVLSASGVFISVCMSVSLASSCQFPLAIKVQEKSKTTPKNTQGQLGSFTPLVNPRHLLCEERLFQNNILIPIHSSKRACLHGATSRQQLKEGSSRLCSSSRARPPPPRNPLPPQAITHQRKTSRGTLARERRRLPRTKEEGKEAAH